MSSDFSVTTIDLLRHGECEGGEIFRGSTDVLLTDTGWQQMHSSLAQEPMWDQLVSSSLKRCRQFSERLSEQSGTPLVVLDELQEIHFGDWEGVDMKVVQQRYKTSLHAFWVDPMSNTPPNGESIVDFRCRVMDCFNTTLNDHSGKHLLFVTHGAVIRVLMCELLKMPLTAISNIAVPYACFTRFKMFASQGKAPWIQLCFHRG